MSPPAGHLLLAQVLLGPWPWASPNRGSSCSAALLRLPARRSLRAAAPRTWRTAPASAGARLLGHCCSWLLGDTGPRLRAQRSARLRPGSSCSAARGTHCPAFRKGSVGKELGRPPLPDSTALRQDRRENPPLPSSCRRAQVQTVNQQACGLSFSPVDWFWIHQLGDATAFSPGQGWPESWDDLQISTFCPDSTKPQTCRAQTLRALGCLVCPPRTYLGPSKSPLPPFFPLHAFFPMA